MIKKCLLVPLAAVVSFIFIFGVGRAVSFSLPIAILLFCALSLPSLFMPLGVLLPEGKIQAFFARAGRASVSCYLYFLVFLLLDGLILLLCDLLSFDLPLPLLLSLSAFCFFLVILIARLNAEKLKILSYTVSLPRKSGSDVQSGKKAECMRVAVLSDLHLGCFTTEKLLSRIENAISSLSADLILCPGDLFDDLFDDIREKKRIASFLSSIRPKYGFFLCPGNHDLPLEKKDERALKFLRRTGITLLEDSAVSLPLFTVIGRKDVNCERLGEKELPFDTSRPTIVLDHHPNRAGKLIDEGAFLVLCGHTHNGQTFPGNIFERLLCRYSHGFHRRKDGYILTTSGCGFAGFPLRLFTRSEIALITLTTPSDSSTK